MGSEQISPEALQQAFALVDLLGAYHLGYLAVAVGLLVVLASAFAWFSLRPIEEKLKNQERNIEKAKKEASEKIDEKASILTAQLSDFEKKINETTTVRVEESHKDTLAQTESRSSLLIAKSKEELIGEVRALEEKISQINVVNAEQEKDIREFSQKMSQIENRIQSIDGTVRWLEGDMFARENRMGGINIPLSELEKIAGTESEYLAPQFLWVLKKGLGDKSGTWLQKELIERIKNMLSKLSGENEEIVSLRAEVLKSLEKK